MGGGAACGDGQYRGDESCEPLTECGAGTRVSTQPTPTSDRECSPCGDGTFNRTLNASSCTAWSECGAGESESVPPSATSDRVCSTCGAGKYEASGECKVLTTCGADQYESTAPTAKSDRSCRDLSTCEPGSKQTAAPTDTSDRQCAACASGTFSNEVNATICETWTVCGTNQKESKAGTPTTDVVCVDKPVCSTAADRACSVDCPCASTEGVCTNDEQCESGASCVSGSGKKVGRTGNTCLATHCNNDTKDSTETSVDCGGECGCRARLEMIPFKGLATDTAWGALRAMSRDGKVLAGDVIRGRTSYAAKVAADGTVTELPAYGKWGAIAAASTDGNILIGTIGCANPPTCTDTTGSIGKWMGSASPTVVRTNSTATGASSSGNVVVGGYYDSGAGQQQAFIISGNSWTSIPELFAAAGVTPDGKYVAGTSLTEKALLWEAQTKNITTISPTTWTHTTVNAINGTTPAVVGRGYISATDTIVAFRWKSGTLTELGLLSGGEYTSPAAVTLDGSTVVGLTGTNDFQQAFIWTDQGKLRTILDELVARGLEPPVDLRLINALLISDDGKTIVGSDPGEPRSFWRATLD
jgi:hypothetical protein